jgi:transcriptional regulator with XRE-family HTH domain
MASAEPHPFAQLLKHHRVAAGLTQEALAERAGLSARSISDMERGLRSAPYQDTIHKLVGGLGLSAAERARFDAAARRRRARIVPHPSTVRVLADALGRSDEDRISFLASARENAVPSTHAAPAPHHLPLHPTPLLGLGREREVAELGAQLRRDDVRLLTLTGTGGVGKTRLAIEAATQLAAAFADSAWFVPLYRISDPELVLPATTHTLELKESGATPLAEVLHRHLRDKELLLVLDNFERLLAVARSIGALLASCPGVKVLVTSRVALRLQGEREYALRPLALPDPQRLPPPEHLAQHAAVALFLERARAAKADFHVTPATAPAVVAICARLDGLPLAIELAAARVKLLSPSALLQRLERSLPMLTGGPRDLDKRQQTLRNTLAWSYDLNLARAHFDEVLTIRRDVGDKEGIVGSLWDTGEVALQRNDLDAAEVRAREALVRARALHYTMAMLAGVEQLGRVAAARGLAPQAVRLLAAARALSDARSVPFTVPSYTLRQHEAARAATRLALGDEAYAAADAAGRALSLEEAIAEALGEQVARVGGRAIFAPM